MFEGGFTHLEIVLGVGLCALAPCKVSHVCIFIIMFIVYILFQDYSECV